MQCFRDAMADCRKNQNIPEDTINKLEQQIDTYDQMLSGHCDDGESLCVSCSTPPPPPLWSCPPMPLLPPTPLAPVTPPPPRSFC